MLRDVLLWQPRSSSSVSTGPRASLVTEPGTAAQETCSRQLWWPLCEEKIPVPHTLRELRLRKSCFSLCFGGEGVQYLQRDGAGLAGALCKGLGRLFQPPQLVRRGGKPAPSLLPPLLCSNCTTESRGPLSCLSSLSYNSTSSNY